MGSNRAFELSLKDASKGRIATVGSTSFGLITSTRLATGDAGSARQIQFAAKVLF